MQSWHPYSLMAAIAAALALSFAAGVESASLNPSAAAERANAENLTADIVKTAPFEHFPSRYQNQATEIEPLPPQF